MAHEPSVNSAQKQTSRLTMQRTRSSSAGLGARPAPHSQQQPPPPPPSASAKTQECHICLEDLRVDLAACPCGHVFHEACITQALEVHELCPSCRGPASVKRLVKLFLELPETNEPSTTEVIVSAQGSQEPQVAALNERLSIVIDRLQWQKKQHDLLLSEMKRARHQTEQLLVDKQTLLHRVGTLESNKNELLSKVAKYQIELSRQTEVARQMAVNQSIINYLNTCDADALEDEIQNPRELVTALKKACKFRHDQYQKAVKEKAKLKSMVQTLQAQLGSGGGNMQDFDSEGLGKRKMKSPMESKRSFSSADYATPHPLEPKKRKITISPAGTTSNASLQPAPISSSAIGSLSARGELSNFRSSAYTDVAVRPLATPSMPRSQTGFGRSNYNPNQYGSYNLAPSHEAPVQTSDHVVCRRGYDETGKLTNYFIPKDPKRTPQSSQLAHVNKAPHQHVGSLGRAGFSGSSSVQSSRPSSSDRRDYPLTNWLRKGSQ